MARLIHDVVRAYIDDAIWVGYLVDSFKTIERDAGATPDGFVYVLRVASTPLGGMVC